MYFAKMVDGKVTGDKSETMSENPASLVVAVLSAIKRQMIADCTIKVEELHIAAPVPDEGDYATEREGKWRSTAHGFARSC